MRAICIDCRFHIRGRRGAHLCGCSDAPRTNPVTGVRDCRVINPAGECPFFRRIFQANQTHIPENIERDAPVPLETMRRHIELLPETSFKNALLDIISGEES